MGKLLAHFLKFNLLLVPVMFEGFLQIFFLLSNVVGSYQSLFGELGYPLLLHAVLAFFLHDSFSFTVINCLNHFSLHAGLEHDPKLVVINGKTAFLCLGQFLRSFVVSFVVQVRTENGFELFGLLAWLQRQSIVLLHEQVLQLSIQGFELHFVLSVPVELFVLVVKGLHVIGRPHRRVSQSAVTVYIKLPVQTSFNRRIESALSRVVVGCCRLKW